MMVYKKEKKDNTPDKKNQQKHLFYNAKFLTCTQHGVWVSVNSFRCSPSSFYTRIRGFAFDRGVLAIPLADAAGDTARCCDPDVIAVAVDIARAAAPVAPGWPLPGVAARFLS